MMTYVCTTATLVNEANKNPFLRLVFKEEGDDLIDQQNGQTINMVISGGVFTADNKPDYAANLKWCQDNADKLVGLKKQIEGFEIPCEPIIRFNREGKPVVDSTGKTKVFGTVTVYQFAKLDAITGEIVPLGGMERLKNQAVRLIQRSSGIKTVAEVKAAQVAKKAAEAIDPLTDNILGDAIVEP